MLGVSQRTLYRWLYDGLVPEPRTAIAGKVKLRTWSAKDVEKARKVAQRRRAKYVTKGRLRLALSAAEVPVSAQYAAGPFPSAIAPQLPADVVPGIMAAAPETLRFEDGLRLTCEFRPEDEVLTPSEVAKRLGVPPSWVYEQTRARASRRSGKPFPYRKIGKYLRFNWRDVNDWVNEQPGRG